MLSTPGYEFAPARSASPTSRCDNYSRGIRRKRVSINRPEFTAKEIQRWLERASVGTLYIQKASLWENGCAESFNGKLRDKLLNPEVFLRLPDVDPGGQRP
jgi:transposase InsO family protein